ncbi:MAG: HAD-IIIC family phosphatase [bacterium]|nr:HAD-IIIC family phosphatase [bacterium]
MQFSELQLEVSNLMAKSGGSVADYLSLAEELPSYADKQPHYFRKIRVAFLSNFTLQALPEVLKVQAVFYNIWADTYLGGYDQYAQDILNLESELYKFKPDLVYFLIDEIGIDKNQIKELANKLSDGGFKTKLIWGSTVKEKFKDHWYTKYKELGDLRLAPQAFPSFSNKELIAEVIAISGSTKKCLVVDLDNTLWNGIVGESDHKEIKPEQDLQKYILELYNKGIILAINSRNNYDDSLSVINEHPDMVLRANNFIAMKINWEDKAKNMIELASELNISLDSFVFIDDDSFQRESIKNRFPEVAVLTPESLKGYQGFSSSALTEEDKNRGKMYAEENKRKKLQSSLGGVEDFLKQLDLKIEIAPINSNSLARVSQLTQKTNQFNLTTRRYSEKEIGDFVADGWKVWTVQVKDKFGDYGIVGVCMIEPKDSIWYIDNFLLSCRILGREIEKVFLGHVLAQAKTCGAASVLGEFIPTAKNQPCQNFYPNNGFNLTRENDNVTSYKHSLAQAYKVPDFIKISYENC